MRAHGAVMNDEIAFDALFALDPSRDSRLMAIQENLIAIEAKAIEAAERFLPESLLRRLKSKFEF